MPKQDQYAELEIPAFLKRRPGERDEPMDAETLAFLERCRNQQPAGQAHDPESLIGKGFSAPVSEQQAQYQAARAAEPRDANAPRQYVFLHSRLDKQPRCVGVGRQEVTQVRVGKKWVRFKFPGAWRGMKILRTAWERIEVKD